MFVEDDSGLESDDPHGVERNLRLGVEAHAQLVGMVDVASAHRPRVEVETPEVGRPKDVGHVDRAQLSRARGRSGS